MLSCVRKEETNGPEENMNSEVKEVAVKMADYSTMEKKTMLKWFNHYYYVTVGNIG